MLANNHFAPLWKDESYAQAISLGNFCHSAQILKDLGYRVFSGPFDWIFSNPKALSHILNDDFKIFLDRSHYYPIPLSERKDPEFGLCEHLFYRNNYHVHHLFNHHLPTEDHDYAHYQQAVNEFRSAARASKPVLYLMVSNHAIALDQYLEVVKALDKYGGNFRLLGVHFKLGGESIDPSLENNVHNIHHDEKLLVSELTVEGLSFGTAFVSSVDNQRFADFLRSFKVASIS